MRRYRPTIARRYGVREHWFAPVAYVRRLPEYLPVSIGLSIFLVTQPLRLDRFLANWRECGLDLVDYEVPILAKDEEFDEFARETFEQDREFLIDPLFVAKDALTLVSGTRLVSLAKIESAMSDGDEKEA